MTEHGADFTPMSMAEIRAMLRLAFESVTGREPNAAELANMAAHVDVETDGGDKMRGHNFGNLTGDYQGHFFPLEAPEFIDGEWTKAEQPYRWYPSPEAGALDYVSLLRRQYPTAWGRLDSTPEAFAEALKHGEPYQYYSAPLEQYQAVMRRRYRGPVDQTDAAWLPLAVTVAALSFVGYRVWRAKKR